MDESVKRKLHGHIEFYGKEMLLDSRVMLFHAIVQEIEASERMIKKLFICDTCGDKLRDVEGLKVCVNCKVVV